MNTVAELVLRVRTALDRADVPYMLTGSFASSVHGTPRATQDIDIVVAPSLRQLNALLQEFASDVYYVSRESALNALARQSQFNVIDLSTGWKIDFIIRKEREFSKTEFARRAPFEAAGVVLEVASPEDTLIAKLEWANKSASQRQLEDAAGILRVQGDQLDQDYIERWVEKLSLTGEWDAVKEMAHLG